MFLSSLQICWVFVYSEYRCIWNPKKLFLYRSIHFTNLLNKMNVGVKISAMTKKHSLYYWRAQIKYHSSHSDLFQYIFQLATGLGHQIMCILFFSNMMSFHQNYTQSCSMKTGLYLYRSQFTNYFQRIIIWSKWKFIINSMIV